MNKNRIEWLDAARGICIFLMIICHGCQSVNRWGNFNGVTGTFFLVFFFWSAGICFNGNSNFHEYIKKQFKKLIVPYSIITGIYLLYRIKMHQVPGDTLIIKMCNLVLSFINSRSNYFYIGPFESFGIGAIWFLVCLFFSTVIYKALYSFKYRGIIIIILMLIGSISGQYLLLPFTIQSAVVGTMFIWIGDTLKDKWLLIANRFESYGWIKSIIIGYLLCILLSCVVHNLYSLHTLLRIDRFLDIGSNNYSVITLPASLVGFILVMLLATTINKIPIIADFMTFCGRETFSILVLHCIDMNMVRYWTYRNVAFMLSALLIYPAIVYVYRIVEKKVLLKFKL